jgi:hypothetical protein
LLQCNTKREARTGCVAQTHTNNGLSDDDLLTDYRSESPRVKYATYEMKVENWNMGTLIDRPATEPG